MPTVASFRVIRAERVLLPHLNLGPVAVGDFEVPAEATRRPAVLTLMVSPSSDMAIGADMRFALDLTGVSSWTTGSARRKGGAC